MPKGMVVAVVAVVVGAGLECHGLWPSVDGERLGRATAPAFAWFGRAGRFVATVAVAVFVATAVAVGVCAGRAGVDFAAGIGP